MTDPLATAIANIVQRMRDKHGVEPRIGYEWEFQLLDHAGRAVPVNEVQQLFGGHNAIGKVYEERFGHGLLGITTKPESPLTAPDTVRSIQERIATWAKGKGYHLSAHPIVSRESDIHAFSGSAGMHVNSSLVKAGADTQDMANRIFSASSILSTTKGELDGLTASVAHGISQVHRDTPLEPIRKRCLDPWFFGVSGVQTPFSDRLLWSYHGKDDMERIIGGDGTPKRYNVGGKGSAGINIGYNKCIPREKIAAFGRDPFGGKDFNVAYLEERYANARVDPHVGAFRSVLGQYHGLENPVYKADAIIQGSGIDLGEIPKQWEKLSGTHVPMNDGSVTKKYVGDLYSMDTLKYIDERGRNPAMRRLESDRFQFRPKPETVSAVAAAAAPASVVRADRSATAETAAPTAPETLSSLETSGNVPTRADPVLKESPVGVAATPVKSNPVPAGAPRQAAGSGGRPQPRSAPYVTSTTARPRMPAPSTPPVAPPTRRPEAGRTTHSVKIAPGPTRAAVQVAPSGGAQIPRTAPNAASAAPTPGPPPSALPASPTPQLQGSRATQNRLPGATPARPQAQARPATPTAPPAAHPLPAMTGQASNMVQKVEQVEEKAARAGKGLGRGGKIAIGVAAAVTAAAGLWSVWRSRGESQDGKVKSDENTFAQKAAENHPADRNSRSWVAAVEASRQGGPERSIY